MWVKRADYFPFSDLGRCKVRVILSEESFALEVSGWLVYFEWFCTHTLAKQYFDMSYKNKSQDDDAKSISLMSKMIAAESIWTDKVSNLVYFEFVYY